MDKVYNGILAGDDRSIKAMENVNKLIAIDFPFEMFIDGLDNDDTFWKNAASYYSGCVEGFASKFK